MNDRLDGQLVRCTECGTLYDEIPNQCQICGAVAEEFFEVTNADE